MCRAHLRSHEKYLQEILLGSGKDTKIRESVRSPVSDWADGRFHRIDGNGKIDGGDQYVYRIGTLESRRYRAGHGKRGRKTVISNAEEKLSDF